RKASLFRTLIILGSFLRPAMRLPIVWQWFPACRDFRVALQARQAASLLQLPKDRLVWSAEPHSAPRNTAKYRGIVEGAKPRSPASRTSGASSQALGSPRAWASRVTIANVAAPADRGFDHISAPQFQTALICS